MKFTVIDVMNIGIYGSQTTIARAEQFLVQTMFKKL